jgi:hypothetical protein
MAIRKKKVALENFVFHDGSGFAIDYERMERILGKEFDVDSYESFFEKLEENVKPTAIENWTLHGPGMFSGASLRSEAIVEMNTLRYPSEFMTKIGRAFDSAADSLETSIREGTSYFSGFSGYASDVADKVRNFEMPAMPRMPKIRMPKMPKVQRRARASTPEFDEASVPIVPAIPIGASGGAGTGGIPSIETPRMPSIELPSFEGVSRAYHSIADRASNSKLVQDVKIYSANAVEFARRHPGITFAGAAMLYALGSPAVNLDIFNPMNWNYDLSRIPRGLSYVAQATGDLVSGRLDLVDAINPLAGSRFGVGTKVVMNGAAIGVIGAAARGIKNRIETSSFTRGKEYVQTAKDYVTGTASDIRKAVKGTVKMAAEHPFLAAGTGAIAWTLGGVPTANYFSPLNWDYSSWGERAIRGVKNVPGQIKSLFSGTFDPIYGLNTNANDNYNPTAKMAAVTGIVGGGAVLADRILNKFPSYTSLKQRAMAYLSK